MSRIIKLIGFLLSVMLLCVGAFFLPPVQQRVGWRLEALRSKVFYFLNPPDQVSFAPQQAVETAVQATLMAVKTAKPAASPTPTSALPSLAPSEAPTVTMTPTITPTPLPGKAVLAGFRYEYQTFNNCGPANLAIALSYWKWSGNQNTTKAVLRPNEDDANVLPEEIVAYAQAQPDMKAALRFGGDLQRVKALLAAGFPVLVEMGHQPKKDWWMGHYVVISGYEDKAARLITQDSLIMPDLPVPYEEIQQHWWRDFNYLYIVLYPSKREAEVLAILGPDADAGENLRRALQKNRDEAAALAGRDLFFSFYNQGDLLLAQGDAAAAAEAYDVAFTLYKSIDEKNRPWRTLWYRPGPYQAYYETGRYQEVIDLADSVLSMLSKRGLEESHYWRGMAYEALGNREQALFDYEIAVKLRPTYGLAREAAARVGQ